MAFFQRLSLFIVPLSAKESTSIALSRKWLVVKVLLFENIAYVNCLIVRNIDFHKEYRSGGGFALVSWNCNQLEMEFAMIPSRILYGKNLFSLQTSEIYWEISWSCAQLNKNNARKRMDEGKWSVKSWQQVLIITSHRRYRPYVSFNNGASFLCALSVCAFGVYVYQKWENIVRVQCACSSRWKRFFFSSHVLFMQEINSTPPNAHICITCLNFDHFVHISLQLWREMRWFWTTKKDTFLLLVSRPNTDECHYLFPALFHHFKSTNSAVFFFLFPPEHSAMHKTNKLNRPGKRNK